MSSSTTPHPDSVTLTEGNGGLPCIQVATPRCHAEVYLHGATVTAWTPTGAEPVLFTSAAARYQPDSAIRGGVPLCAPWFGPGTTGSRTPAHGFFRILPWELTDATDDDGTVTLTLTLDGHAVPADLGPADLTASYQVRFGDHLDMALTITAGETDLALENALHTYLRVGDATQISLEGLDGCRYADKAPGGRAVNAQSGDIRITRETDRIYAHDSTVTVVDPTLGRRIVVTKEGSASTIVWNPWTAKAVHLNDFGDDEWTNMICVESGNVQRHALTVAAGQSHTLRQCVALAAL
ncbi:putative glucose-6-phosphate 1-epimerase [Austwickia sp. TVS 96-490-7B]|uniref:D-hexose-6-phosphate mutarotase n=1 Tax=Austwickia sp. TVS 96-490-7B TaxID=2830843 RepID=UPI001C59D765|nr:D-hexose-6-phosphate mutarotase [Austwickia sp. TVS 96-490-7B]MBW3086868.1 putative glucose-6-phosphate 1-epimerase [Austwickia sp. TVS 96-490-7B]